MTFQTPVSSETSGSAILWGISDLCFVDLTKSRPGIKDGGGTCAVSKTRVEDGLVRTCSLVAPMFLPRTPTSLGRKAPLGHALKKRLESGKKRSFQS